MQEVIKTVSFELHSPDLLPDWQSLSKSITDDLQGVEGFISRDSAQDENGLIYCIVRWKDASYQEKFMQEFSARDDFDKNMEEFGKIANMETMKSQSLSIL
jgi:hypothetical protein